MPNVYDTPIALNIGQVPDDVLDPVVYLELQNVHNALEHLAVAIDNNRMFGIMSVNAEIPIAAGAGPFIVANVTNDGWTAGPLYKVTFPTGGDERYLQVQYPGRYEVHWSLSVHTIAVAVVQIYGGVIVDAAFKNFLGESQTTITNANYTRTISSVSVIDCANANEKIGLWVQNSGGGVIHVARGSMMIRRVADR